jgi:hypothetical protein
MKVKVLRDFLGSNGVITSGTVLDVSEQRARELENKKPPLAVPLIDRARVDALKEAAGDGSVRPTQTPPPGGQTGEGKPVLLSHQVQAPRTRRSRRPKTAPA